MKRLAADDGIALVPAIAVTFIVLLLGAATLSTVNVQTNQSGAERSQEGSFQVAESALNAQLVQLSRTWPSTAAAAYPTCSQSSLATTKCSGSTLTSNFTTAGTGGSGPNGGSDFVTTPAWTTRVIDDAGGPDYYDESLASGATPAYDANANGSVWVRSEAVVDEEKSVVVSLVRQGAPRLEQLPSSTIIAGWFQTSNEGKKVIVDAAGTSATAGAVQVRCSTTGPDKNDDCLGYDPDKGQLSPAEAYQTGYVDGTGVPNATNRHILDADARERLKARAQSEGTYYATGCPTTLTGAMVYVENANCSYTANSVYNSAANPGVVIFARGTLSVGGDSAFHGLIYMVNGQGTAPASGPCVDPHRNAVVNLGGTTQIYGSIMIDRCGGVIAGSSKVNIVFDANVFANVVSTGIAAGVKNSFRIVPTS